MAQPAPVPTNERNVTVNADGVTLRGILGVPQAARGVVLFAHGSGSGRLSPRNQAVARQLQQNHFGTMLVDLLEEPESRQTRFVFDVDLLAERLGRVADWFAFQPDLKDLPLGLFGASTGAAAALIMAAKRGEEVRAVVARGGRPDLANGYLAQVIAPTLLIVGGDDPVVVQLNQEAMRQMSAPRELAIVPNATHLFEEPGALEEVSRLASDWFSRYLVARP